MTFQEELERSSHAELVRLCGAEVGLRKRVEGQLLHLRSTLEWYRGYCEQADPVAAKLAQRTLAALDGVERDRGDALPPVVVRTEEGQAVHPTVPLSTEEREDSDG